MRPTLARINSVKSGFFFCGIALDPVENASGRITKPNSAVANSVISSANRLRCNPTNVSACRYSRMKSRSLVASIELAVGAVNPKLARSNGSVQRQRRAGNRARSQRAIIQPRRAILSADRHRAESSPRRPAASAPPAQAQRAADAYSSASPHRRLSAPVQAAPRPTSPGHSTTSSICPRT